MGIGDIFPAYMVIGRLEGATPLFLFTTDQEAAEWALEEVPGYTKRMWQAKVKVGAELEAIPPGEASLKVKRPQEATIDRVDVTSGMGPVTYVPIQGVGAIEVREQ